MIRTLRTTVVDSIAEVVHHFSDEGLQRKEIEGCNSPVCPCKLRTMVPCGTMLRVRIDDDDDLNPELLSHRSLHLKKFTSPQKGSHLSDCVTSFDMQVTSPAEMRIDGSELWRCSLSSCVPRTCVIMVLRQFRNY